MMEDAMAKISLAAMMFIAESLFAMSGATLAQTQTTAPTREPGPTSLLRQDYLTTTGQTVPHPGASQGAGVTPLDRGIQRRDDLLEKGICGNC
jgi:hypothetical protein